MLIVGLASLRASGDLAGRLFMPALSAPLLWASNGREAIGLVAELGARHRVDGRADAQSA